MRKVIVVVGGIAASVVAAFFVYQVVHQGLAQVADAQGAGRAFAYLPIVVVVAAPVLLGWFFREKLWTSLITIAPAVIVVSMFCLAGQAIAAGTA
jgi:hypothetical protein